MHLVFERKENSQPPEPDPTPRVELTDTEKQWLYVTQEKRDLRKTRGVYAAKRSRNDDMVEEIFTSKNIQPTKGPCQVNTGGLGV